MGYDDVVAFLHDGPSDGMALTIFGSLKSIKSMKRIPSRIPISIPNPYHERERDMECPTRDRDRESPYAKDIDVRYLKNIKRLKNRIKCSYTCDQQICPMIKERLDQHQMDRHSSFKSRCQERDIDSQTVILPTVSRHRTSTKSGPNLVDTHSIQTNITSINNTSNEVSNNNKYNFNNETNNYDFGEVDAMRPNNHSHKDSFGLTNINNASDDKIPLKRTETRSVVTPKRNIYKDYVQREVREWFQEVPIYPNIGHCNFDKDNFINDLTEKINNLLNEINNEAYDRIVKVDIDSSLNMVPMWYPGAKRDQDFFKDRLNDNLLNRIKILNKKLLNNNDQTNADYRRSSKIEREIKGESNSQEIEEEVSDWISMIKFRKNSGMQMNVNKREIVKNVVKKIAPLLAKPMNSCNYKIILKRAIFDALNDLPIGARCSKNRNIDLNKFCDDLADRLLSIKAKAENNCNQYYNTQRTMHQTSEFFVNSSTKNYFENIIRWEVSKCLVNTILAPNKDVKMEITDIIMDYVDSPVPVEEFDVSKEILDVLKNASNMPDFIALNIAQNLIREVKDALNKNNNEAISNIKSSVTRKISVYTSVEKCCPRNYATSTPKKIKVQSVSKLNPEEIEYAEKVGNLIRAWMETLPEQFNGPDEKDFKETVIKDLAGEITDEAKLEQLASVDEKDKWLKYLIYKWLHKLDVFDLEEVAPQIEELLKRVRDIPVPLLTRPQHGNRQAMANIQHMESELGWEEYFVPKGKDILEDEISIWMNQQPSEIFNTDKNARNNEIQKLAEILQNKLTNKQSENEITKDVEQWLNRIVKPDDRINVSELANNLKRRVVNLPQDATLAANRDKKIQQKIEHLEAKNNPCCQPVKVKTTDNDTINLDKTMQQFIGKFIEHNYDVDDPMARGAFSHLLKTKLQRLNPPTRKEVYENFAKSVSIKQFSREKLIKELDYIKDVSDWLKNIPIDASFNTVGNRERVDFVTDLARNILEVEEQREGNPEAMDYNMYMASIISQFLVQLPIKEECKNDKNMLFMIDQLVGKVIVHRNKNQNQTNDYIDTSGIHNENIGDFIEEFIRVNGSEIADDEVKLEAWSVRLLSEIKKMVRENADPTALSKAHVYNRLVNIPLPIDESIKQFDNELEYIKEISEWIKNFPLLPIDETIEKERIKMICELSEKITERDSKKSDNPNDKKFDAEFADYISKWISDLSLDESHEVVVAVVIQQLVNRIERVKVRHENPDLDFSKIKEKESSENNTSKIIKKQSSKAMKAGKNKQMKNPASTIVDTIEKWSDSLPIKSSDEKVMKSLKDDASKKLFQKVGELSIDPRTFNDDLLYQDILTDEVDAIIEKLPQSPELQNNKEKLRTDLVQSIVEAQKAIKENCAGEFYKQKLEHTIEASIPHPIKARQVYDPGFEIYKSRLADIFILENFDHANDAVKIKYERRIKEEIDRYYDNVKNKNAIPLTKDEIYNELYSALFKVPIPDKSSTVGEVEEIKTRCEIDSWFEQLPLKETNDLTEMLTRDKILATLAKRIHEIEKADSKPADKIHKEIMKWVVKLPLLPGEEGNAEQFAKKLQDTLKSSSDKRKCVAIETSSKSKKGKTKVKSKEKIKVNKDVQIPGPSTEGKMRESHTEPVKPKKKAAEIIIEIVEEWCNLLPIYATTPQEEETAKIMRDNLCTKIIIKISELNMNPAIFNDDYQYDDLLDEELDILLTGIPTCCNFEESKAARKMQLKDAIKSVKPLFRDEKAKHQYKQDLDTTVAKVLGKPQDTTADKEALFKDLKDEIIENFVQFNYDKDDYEGRQAYKIKIHDAVMKYLTEVVENKDATAMDPLMRRNQLLCELAKVPVINDDGLKEEVEELRMKTEVTELFDELSLSETDKDKKNLIKQVKSSLAKKLNDIELSGHNVEDKMKQEVTKSLKKINKEVKPEIISDFVSKLKSNETIRRAPRKIKANTTCGEDCKMAGICGDNAQSKEKSNSTFLDNSNTKKQNSSRYITDAHENISQNTTDSKHCLEHCRNLPKSTENVTPKQESNSKSQVECACPKNEFQRENPENERQENINKSLENIYDEERCICGGMRRRPCFMPMRWFCNGPEENMPICRVPAGFFYY